MQYETRSFAVDVLRGLCVGRCRLLACITDPAVIARILAHLKLPTEPPALAPARSPPELAMPF